MQPSNTSSIQYVFRLLLVYGINPCLVRCVQSRVLWAGAAYYHITLSLLDHRHCHCWGENDVHSTQKQSLCTCLYDKPVLLFPGVSSVLKVTCEPPEGSWTTPPTVSTTASSSVTSSTPVTSTKPFKAGSTNEMGECNKKQC